MLDTSGARAAGSWLRSETTTSAPYVSLDMVMCVAPLSALAVGLRSPGAFTVIVVVVVVCAPLLVMVAN